MKLLAYIFGIIIFFYVLNYLIINLYVRLRIYMLKKSERNKASFSEEKHKSVIIRNGGGDCAFC